MSRPQLERPQPDYVLAALVVVVFLLLWLIAHQYIVQGILLGLRWLS